MTLTVVTYCLLALSILLAVVTFLPLSKSPRWWVRASEFPRMQVAVIAIPLLVATVWMAFAGYGQTYIDWLAAAITAVSLGAQAIWCVPYTPLMPREMKRAPEGPGTVSFLASNVLMQNERKEDVANEIRRLDPDVVLLMETDQAWIDAMEPALAGYDFILRYPLDNCYGMVLATRLKVETAQFVLMTEDDTPTAFARLRTPDGTAFRFIGLHPVPPVPGQDTMTRDAEVLYAARYAGDSDEPVVAMGDFNTVAWSRAAHQFKQGGGFLDARIGRGPMPSFDARRWWMRLPIDQFYLTQQAAMVSYERGRFVGSDHFPMFARVRFDAEIAKGLNREILPVPDHVERDIRELVETHDARLERHHGAKRIIAGEDTRPRQTAEDITRDPEGTES
ncbi:endonuclease/exonuclease/phosphatase family protein [Pseudoroseicyclus aestuarii]|uniref:Endonuclease/exonuclease/phosphatase (EEP) superfamily protein YafD n=1 Tax=Pseudoroseicyclus aestuarii TaxID=1795041 RepID=A0A318T5V4_9RHOB|nr:endonuclease/exonuclease/phosphatase family protein [Pseudoroseicyclus aestuarii]PYE85784.1 endonuclease/exonuclease/phosphatase (EEP) superfamily protein YafD [Pseudoroseicyclus aestuarii]